MGPSCICCWFFLTLGGLFLVWFLVFENFEIVFGIKITTFGGLFYKTFWFEASLYMFLIFWKFRGPLLSLIFSFWKFWNFILNQNSHFWRVCFIKLFDLRSSYICFYFLVEFLFLKISILFFKLKFPFLWGLFYRTFCCEASSYLFFIFREFLFVWFLVFENF